MRKVPTNSFYTHTGKLLRDALAFKNKGGRGSDILAFEEAFAEYIGVERAFLVGSGTSALYIILKALMRFSNKTEVVLPAYTVPTLTLAIAKAGLKTRLAEIDINTFNLDPQRFSDVISKKDTLAVVPVHMFGFPMELSEICKSSAKEGFYVVEDCAQAPGAKISGRRVGGESGVGFFSMCKGKIISAFRGGIITADNKEIALEIEKEISSMPTPGRLFDLNLFVALFLINYATIPSIYGPLFKLISLFKSTEVHERFEPSLASPFAARLGLTQLEAIDTQLKRRTENAMALYKALEKIDGVGLPNIIEGASPAFNHLPVMIQDNEMLSALTKILFKRGIDTARMYERPIHKIYDLQYPDLPDPFPKATELSEGLMVLPVHPGVTKRDLGIIIETFKEIFC